MFPAAERDALCFETVLLLAEYGLVRQIGLHSVLEISLDLYRIHVRAHRWHVKVGALESMIVLLVTKGRS